MLHFKKNLECTSTWFGSWLNWRFHCFFSPQSRVPVLELWSKRSSLSLPHVHLGPGLQPDAAYRYNEYRWSPWPPSSCLPPSARRQTYRREVMSGGSGRLIEDFHLSGTFGDPWRPDRGPGSDPTVRQWVKTKRPVRRNDQMCLMDATETPERCSSEFKCCWQLILY